MLTAMLQLDDEVIGTVYCVNAGPLAAPEETKKEDRNSEEGEWCEFAYEYHRECARTIRGTVKHYRPNGAIALMKEICEDIETKGGK